MRRQFLLALACILGAACLASAQEKLPPPPAPHTPVVTGAPICDTGCPKAPACCEPGERLWFQADYILWWVNKTPLPTPLVSTGPLTDPFPGALDQPNTQILYGGENVGLGMFSGLRLSGGYWLDREATWGVEASWFFLETRSDSFASASDPLGNPYVARPFLRTNTGAENVYFVSLPGVISGGIDIKTSSNLWSWDVNGAALLTCRKGFRAVALAGVRSLDLQEDLSVGVDFGQILPGLNAAVFNNAEVNPPGRIATSDSFRAYNRFYGPQVGGRADWDLSDRVSIGLLGKLALGVTNQEIRINGSSTLLSPAGPVATLPGGVYTQTSNIGSHTRSRFSVVPEVGLNVGVKIVECLHARIGYSFVYWSNVVRPGNQVDRSINTNLVPTDIDFGTPGGVARPTVVMKDSDFWAQGLNLGLEFRY